MENQLGSPTLPTGGIVWVSHYDKEHDLRYIITSKPVRDSYSLYELKEGRFVRWGRGQDPQKLAERYDRASQISGPELEEDYEPEL